MASSAARLIWSTEAFSAFQGLPPSIGTEVLRRIELLAIYPRMYQVEPNGRWAGLRRFFVRDRVVYYSYWDPDHTVYVEAIRPARSEERSSGGG